MNVLSLFDGISCGQLALKSAGVPIDNYFASEIDKNAVKVTQYHFPDTVQLGDVTTVCFDDLPKIDLICGGNPCQSFSFSGKQVNFNDPRGQLFFQYVRLLKECESRFFLLENVRMKKQYQDVISEQLGVEPILVNSNTVSAQSRNRLYWTNIPFKPYQTESPYFVKDILDKVYNGGRDPSQEEVDRDLKRLLAKSKYRDTFQWKYDTTDRILVQRPDGLKIQRIGRVAMPRHKSCIIGCTDQPYIWDGREIRKVTPKEAERLQTLPDYYTAILGKDNPRYKAIGNGWTVNVIAKIFEGLKNNA